MKLAELLVGSGAALAKSGGSPAKRVLLVVFACLAAFLVAGCSGAGGSALEEEAEAFADRPNMIFVLADDLDYASAQEMPQVRALLAEQGASFESAFTSMSLCCPSRATILTGLYAHNSGVQGNRLPKGGFEKFRDEGLEEGTVATRLQDEGYRTAYLGKYLNEYGKDDPTYVPPGWDEWYGKLNEQKLYDYAVNKNGEVVSYGSEEGDFYTDVLAGQATDFVGRAATEDRPFFAFVAPTAPHGPATPAERHEGTFEGEQAPRSPSFNEEDVSDKPSWRQEDTLLSEEEVAQIDAYHRQRLESALAVDEMVGALVEELEAAGELDNTYVFFTSDNGFHLGTHRLRHGKKTPYEEAARVPLFVRGPGVPVGSTVEDLTLDTDLAPTFAELGGLEGFGADGRSLLSLVRGGAPSWRSAVLLEAFLDGKSAREGEDEQTEDEEGDEGGEGGAGEGNRTDNTAFTAVRTGTHKYVEHENGESELYDLSSDPYELENVYETAEPALVEDLRARLEALRVCEGDRCREAEDAP